MKAAPWLLLLAAVLTSSAAAQEVRGTVRETGGQAVVGARVTLVDSAGQALRSDSTDRSGQFSLRAATPGVEQRPAALRPTSGLYGQAMPKTGAGDCMTPQGALASVSAADIASIEYVPPIEAGAIYGMGHGYGAVVIHTRRK